MNKLFNRNRGGNPFIMAGPCSAESEDQLVYTARELKERGVSLFRAGLWKPRTRPDAFSGHGENAIQWLSRVRDEVGIPVATEVANPRHVEMGLKNGIDVFWIGARTVANPFSIQDIADALKGVDVPVIVKNPINPDLYLWLGAVERLEYSGITDMCLIHRGFSFFNTGKYRNSPMWQIPIDMRGLRPELMMLCDISHISGRREILAEVAQAAMDLAYDGLMVEVHHDPDNALSDAQQQISIAGYDRLIHSLVIRNQTFDDVDVREDIAGYRDQIDKLDEQLIELLSLRMQLARQIGEIKNVYDIPVLQPKRWQQILTTARQNGLLANLTPDFIEELFKAIHQESIHHQIEVMNVEKVQPRS